MRDVLHQEDERSVQRDLHVFPERAREKDQLDPGGGGPLGSFLVHGDDRLLHDPADCQGKVGLQHFVQLSPCSSSGVISIPLLVSLLPWKILFTPAFFIQSEISISVLILNLGIITRTSSVNSFFTFIPKMLTTIYIRN